MKKWKRWIRFIVSIIILGICVWFSVDLMNKDTVTYEVYVSQCIDGDTAVFTAHVPNPGIKPGSPALQADSLPTEL